MRKVNIPRSALPYRPDLEHDRAEYRLARYGLQMKAFRTLDG